MGSDPIPAIKESVYNTHFYWFTLNLQGGGGRETSPSPPSIDTVKCEYVKHGGTLHMAYTYNGPGILKDIVRTQENI